MKITPKIMNTIMISLGGWRTSSSMERLLTTIFTYHPKYYIFLETIFGHKPDDLNYCNDWYPWKDDKKTKAPVNKKMVWMSG